MRTITQSIVLGTSLVAGVLALSGCPDRTIANVTPQQQGAVIKKIPVSADIDILFVIDNSASTADKQTAFAANFVNFVAALDAFPSGRPNLHIGIVSSTVGIGSDANFGSNCPKTAPNDDGLLQNTPRVSGCVAPTGRFISDIKNSMGTRTVNYTGTLDTTLSCIAQLGTGGCGFEAQLEAMKRALDGSRPENAGFLRQGAYLAVIFLTDEDDFSVKDPGIFALALPSVSQNSDFRGQPLYAYKCDQAISSMGPGPTGGYTNCSVLTNSYLQDPGFYYTFLSTVKDPAQIVVALIAGDVAGHPPSDTPIAVQTGPVTFGVTGTTQPLALEPSCMFTNSANQTSIGRPAIRLDTFRKQFADHGLFGTICQKDYSAVVANIGKLLFNAISPCLEGNIDTTPAYPGGQPQCTVSDVQVGQAEQLILPCVMSSPGVPDPNSPKPCWWVKSNPAACSTTTGLELHIERSTPAATGTTVEVSCATVPAG